MRLCPSISACWTSGPPPRACKASRLETSCKLFFTRWWTSLSSTSRSRRAAPGASARADETLEGVALPVPRHAVVQDPTVLTVRAQQPIFHAKRLAPHERVEVPVHAVLKVFRVHPFGPAVASLLLERATGEGEPGR